MNQNRVLQSVLLYEAFSERNWMKESKEVKIKISTRKFGSHAKQNNQESNRNDQKEAK